MVLVAVALAPGVFWLWYFLARDRLRPEPRALVGRVFVLGALAAIPAALAEQGMLSWLGLSTEAGGVVMGLAAALIVAVIEETAKFVAVVKGIYRNVAFDEVMDGIVYAVAASLGFATLENVFYVLEGGVGVGILRALLAVPGHAFFGALMGYPMGLARFAGARERRLLTLCLLLAVLTHTAYDALLFTRTAAALAVVPLILWLWRRSLGEAMQARALDDSRAARS